MKMTSATVKRSCMAGAMRVALSLLPGLAALMPAGAAASIGATMEECMAKYGAVVEQDGMARTFVRDGLFFMIEFQAREGRAETMLIGRAVHGKADFGRPLAAAEIPLLLKTANGAGTWELDGAAWKNGSLRALLVKGNAALHVRRTCRSSAVPAMVTLTAPPAELEVIHEAVKRIKVPDLIEGEKRVFRYFFAVKNRSHARFQGAVAIRLVNQMLESGDEAQMLQCDIPGEGTDHGYIDRPTGPVVVQGDRGTLGYVFEAKRGERVVAKGKGALSERFEDLTMYN